MANVTNKSIVFEEPAVEALPANHWVTTVQLTANIYSSPFMSKGATPVGLTNWQWKIFFKTEQ